MVAFLTFTLENSEAQTERYQTRTGKVNFKATVPTFEPIEAINESTTVVIDVTSGNLAALALLKGFRFPIALMQEHFNENYVESDEYPKATIKGTLTGFDVTSLSQNISKNYTLDGTLELHGVTRSISIPVALTRSGESLQLSSNFSLVPQDYGIQIPKIVANKIADEVLVSVEARLSRK